MSLSPPQSFLSSPPSPPQCFLPASPLSLLPVSLLVSPFCPPLRLPLFQSFLSPPSRSPFSSPPLSIFPASPLSRSFLSPSPSISPFCHPLTLLLKKGDLLTARVTISCLFCRADEEEYVAERDSNSSTGRDWEKVCRMCDFNPKGTKNTKDVSRMRSIFLQLKQNPLPDRE